MSSHSARTVRLALLAVSGLMAASPVLAQDWSGGYRPPPPTYPGSYYGQVAYAPAPYSQPAYAPANDSYGYAPNASAAQTSYDDLYAAQRAWRRQARQAQYQQAYAPPPRTPYAAPAEPQILDTAAPAPATPPVRSVAETPPARPSLPTAPTSVALSHRVVESASAYLAYMNKASALSPLFADGVGVAKDVRVGAAYEPKQFEEGAIAYAAIVALQEPAFIDGVRAASQGDPDRAQAIAADLMHDPAGAARFAGADAAAARAGAALRRQGDRLLDAGTRMKQAAYDVQHAAWSKGDVVEPDVRLAGAKALSATRAAPARVETDQLLKTALAEQGSAERYAVGEGASPVVSLGLALAALAVLGQAGEDRSDQIAALLAEEKGGECLKMAKLNLFQCLAVAGPHYEDIFCLGQHAMMDTAQCVIKASGVSQPMTTMAAAAPARAAATPAAVSPAPQDYWLPVGAQTVSMASAMQAPSR
jgi:hypothetical protein